MDIDFIIPAKTSSQRVPNKNWRPFRGEDSLVDLVIEKLLNCGVDAERIHISCECEQTALPTAHRWGVNFLKRSSDLFANEVPLTKWIRSITAQVPGESDIAWCQVCDPLFDEYAECLEKWSQLSRTQYDSLVVCYPWRGYLMTAEGQPIGWSFGEHHTPSQKLPEFRTMPFTLSLLTRQAIERTGYHVGARPFWYVSRSEHVDVDSVADYCIAQNKIRFINASGFLAATRYCRRDADRDAV